MIEVFLGVDIGGSHVGVGCVSAVDGILLCSSSAPLYAHSTFEGLVDFVCEIVSDMLKRESVGNVIKLDVIGVGVGCPGQCKDGILIGACIFPFKKVPLADAVSSRLSIMLKSKVNIPTVLLNDADAAIAAEVWGSCNKALYGSAKNIAMITIGTGLGLGLVLDGKLYQGSRGLIEGGHMIIDNKSHGRICSCGQVGCVEAYSSAKNTSIRMFETDVAEERARAKKRKSFRLDPQNVAGKSVLHHLYITDNVTDDLITQYDAVQIEMGDAVDVFSRAESGDESAKAVLNETAEALAIFCINLCRIIDPEFIIIGGGMSQAGSTLLSLIQSNFQERSWTILDDDVKIVIASNSKYAGIIGAALHASACHFHVQDCLALQNMMSFEAPQIKASKSLDVLNYMHSNRHSMSYGSLDQNVSSLGSGEGSGVNRENFFISPNTTARNDSFPCFGNLSISNESPYYNHGNPQYELQHDEGNKTQHDEGNKTQKSEHHISKNFNKMLIANCTLSILSGGALAYALFRGDSNSTSNEGGKINKYLHCTAILSQICLSSYFLYNTRANC